MVVVSCKPVSVTQREWIHRGRTKRSGGRGNYNQDTLYEKKILFAIKEKKLKVLHRPALSHMRQIDFVLWEFSCLTNLKFPRPELYGSFP